MGAEARPSAGARTVPASVLRRASRMRVVFGRGGSRPGERPTGRAGVGTVFREHRPYSPGDDLRYVDWNVWARRRARVVKVHQEEAGADVLLSVDTSASMWRSDEKRGAATTACALVGAAALASGGTVRVRASRRAAVLGGARAAPQTAGRGTAFRGRGAVSRLLAALAGLPDDTSPPAPARGPVQGRERRGLTVFAGDFLDPVGGPHGSEAAFRAARRAGADVVALHVVGPREREPRVDGRVRLVDVESGALLDVDVDETVRARYRDAFDRHVARVAGAVRDVGGRHVLVATDAAPAAVLATLVRRGLLR